VGWRLRHACGWLAEICTRVVDPSRNATTQVSISREAAGFCHPALNHCHRNYSSDLLV
jgi:hypothetical protein